jgi:hypothetical protein
MRGKKRSAEVKQKIRAASIKRWAAEKTQLGIKIRDTRRLNRLEGKLRKPHPPVSESTKQKLHEATTKQWARMTPDEKAKFSKGLGPK